MNHPLRVFLCRSEQDKKTDEYKDVKALRGCEVAPGRKVEFVEGDARAGAFIDQVVADRIKSCDACVFIQTSRSLKSEYCLMEVGAFWGQHKSVIILNAGPPLKVGLKPLVGVKIAAGPADVREALEEIALNPPNDDRRVGSLSLADLKDLVQKSLNPIRQGVAAISDRVQQLSPFTRDSIFGERYEHFLQEKRAIAIQLMVELERHIKDLKSQGAPMPIQLVLDSGTTVFPVFKLLMLRKSEEFWTKSVEIVTNNIPGLLTALDEGKTDSGDRHAKTAYDVHVVNGDAAPAYWAVLPEDPDEALRRCLDQAPGRKSVIVTTSNWISRDGSRLFVRNERHFKFKKALMNQRDSRVFILTPLGKMIHADSKEMNEQLVLPSDRENPERLYRELGIESKDSDRITWITTDRSPQDALFVHSRSVREEFSQAKRNLVWVPVNGFRIRDFTRGDIDREEELEIPHKPTAILKRWLSWSPHVQSPTPTPQRRKSKEAGV